MKSRYYFLVCIGLLTIGFTSLANLNLTAYPVVGTTPNQGQKAQSKKQKPAKKASPNNTRSFLLTNKPTVTDAYSFVLAPGITAVKSVAVQGGGNSIPGSQLNYTIVLNNSGTDATGVILNDVLVNDLTLVAGSVKATPIIVDDSYNCIGNVGITVRWSRFAGQSSCLTWLYHVKNSNPVGSAPKV
jgi:uncharacterized repeat protein (TIGR01451 family)